MMKRAIAVIFLAGTASVAFLSPPLLLAQSCQDEEAMVQDSRKTITDFVDTVKKEGLQDFQSKFHQKSCLSKLAFVIGMANELIGCLDKAKQDAAATKEQVDAYKAKRESTARLKAKLEHGRDQLKATEIPKDAKALIEKFDLSD